MDTKPPDDTMGEPPTLETLVRDHADQIRRWVVQKGVPEPDDDDVVQETLLNACKALPTFDPARGHIRAWLKAITHHHVTHYLQRAHRRREQEWPGNAFEPADGAPSSETRYVQEEGKSILCDLLFEIPIDRRRVVVAHELDELPVEEVAEKLAIPVTTVRSRLRGAMADLKAAAHRWKARRRGRGFALCPGIAIECLQEDCGDARLLRRWLHRLRRVVGTAVARVGAPGATMPAQWMGRVFLLPMASVVAAMVMGGLVLTGHTRAEAEQPALPDRAAAIPMMAAVVPAVSPVRAENDIPTGQETLSSVLRVSPGRDSPPSTAADVRGRPPRRAALEADEQHLLRMAKAAQAIEQKDLARSLMDQYRRELPRGRLARGQP